jgi:hypothetical protein
MATCDVDVDTDGHGGFPYMLGGGLMGGTVGVLLKYCLDVTGQAMSTAQRSMEVRQ